MNARRYIIAAGLAASEVGAVMTLQSIRAAVTGVLAWRAVAPVMLVFIGLGIWLWWRRSRVAAGLMLALVGFEYVDVAITYGRSNTWLATYLCLFLIAISVHGSKTKETPPAARYGADRNHRRFR